MFSLRAAQMRQPDCRRPLVHLTAIGPDLDAVFTEGMNLGVADDEVLSRTGDHPATAVVLSVGGGGGEKDSLRWSHSNNSPRRGLWPRTSQWCDSPPHHEGGTMGETPKEDASSTEYQSLDGGLGMLDTHQPGHDGLTLSGATKNHPTHPSNKCFLINTRFDGNDITLLGNLDGGRDGLMVTIEPNDIDLGAHG